MIFQVFSCSDDGAVIELFWTSEDDYGDDNPDDNQIDIYPSSLGRISSGISFLSWVKSVPWKIRTSWDFYTLISLFYNQYITLALSLRKGFTRVISVPKILKDEDNLTLAVISHWITLDDKNDM